MTVWTVCQANDPMLSLLPSADGKFSDFGTRSSLIQAKPGYVTLGRDEKQGLKIGVPVAGQNGWVACVFNGPDGGKVMLVQSHRLIGGSSYPDGGLQAELYTSPIRFARYTEMELLSPLVSLRAGDKLEDDRIWQVVPVEHDEYGTAAAKAHAHALEELK